MPDKTNAEKPQAEPRAAVLSRAEQALLDAIERLRARYQPNRPADKILVTVKAVLHSPLMPSMETVFQRLYDRERSRVFNDRAENEFPDVRRNFDAAIVEFAAKVDDTSRRTALRIAANAWKSNRDADRRALAGERHPYKGRPVEYDQAVVWAFVDSIVSATGQNSFATGHHGDQTLIDEASAGPMLNALVASVRWAMTAAWMIAAPPEATTPPTVRTEGILSVIKRGR